MTPAYILHAGRILPVVAQVRQNNIPFVCVMTEPGVPALVPLSVAIAAPVRTRPKLVVDNTKHGG